MWLTLLFGSIQYFIEYCIGGRMYRQKFNKKDNQILLGRNEFEVQIISFTGHEEFLDSSPRKWSNIRYQKERFEVFTRK